MQIVGLDLGQTSDPSACAVFTRKDFIAPIPSPLPPKPERFGPPKPPRDTSWDVIEPGLAARQAAELRRYKELSPVLVGDRNFDSPEDLAQVPKLKTERKYLCRMLRKWPLQTSYINVCADVRNLCANPMLQVDSDGVIRPPTLVIDATGLGRPIFDIFVAAKVPARLIGIVITGGNSVRQDENAANIYHVPKIFLVNTLQSLLQSARIDFPPKLRDPITGEDMQEALSAELKNFRQEMMISAKRGKPSTSFEADEGSHDDVLMGASYAVWFGELGGRIPKVW